MGEPNGHLRRSTERMGIPPGYRKASKARSAKAYSAPAPFCYRPPGIPPTCPPAAAAIVRFVTFHLSDVLLPLPAAPRFFLLHPSQQRTKNTIICLFLVQKQVISEASTTASTSAHRHPRPRSACSPPLPSRPGTWSWKWTCAA